MSRILVVSPPELGHLLPVLPVAQRLREHGHEVVFLSTAETRWLLERYHFSTELWIEPAETTCCRTFSPPSHIPAGASFWYDFTRRSRSTKLDAIQKRLEAVAIRCCSEHFVMDSLFALHYGIDCSVHPFFGRVTLLGTSLARWNDFPTSIPAPLLYLCPDEFEVPSYVLKHPRVRYCEPSISQPYDATEDSAFQPATQRPLVLIACGTQASLQRSFMDRLQAISDVAHIYSDIDFVVGVSDLHKEALETTNQALPTNVVLQTRIPQSKLLKHALAFITHGGLSSMKEAILAGVPMIVTPEVFDQPFNAMRAVYHDLAPAIFPDEMNGTALEKALGGILNRSSLAGQVGRFQSIFARADAQPQAAQFIEDQICSKHFI